MLSLRGIWQQDHSCEGHFSERNVTNAALSSHHAVLIFLPIENCFFAMHHVSKTIWKLQPFGVANETSITTLLMLPGTTVASDPMCSPHR